MAPEGYILEVQKNRIEIKAAKPAGFFYATQTLRQLLRQKLKVPRNKIIWIGSSGCQY